MLPVPVLQINHVQSCRILERINRFVVLIETSRGRFRAHINNTGRLTELLVPGKTAYCLPRSNPGKTAFRLFAIPESGGAAIIDTQLQMRSFEAAIELRLIPWLPKYQIHRRNARLGASLIDYLLQGNGSPPLYLEVKSAVLRSSLFASYPDCPSLRGQKHIKELTEWVRKGGRATILFMAALPNVFGFHPDRSADPELARLLESAHSAGVEVRAMSLHYSADMASIDLADPDLKVCLS